jgi:serine/threonine protein phosphatase 1
VHGHTILPEPLVAGGRIGVDTGAYATGRLTAALVGAGGVEFIST